MAKQNNIRDVVNQNMASAKKVQETLQNLTKPTLFEEVVRYIVESYASEAPHSIYIQDKRDEAINMMRTAITKVKKEY